MQDWNVVVTVYEEGFADALKALREFGPVEPTGFHNVLVMKVEDPLALLNALERSIEADAYLGNTLSRAAPCQRTFDFTSPEDFEEQARRIALEWAPQLAGRAFHVRFHRRGFKHQLSSQSEERFLDEALLQALEQAGQPGKIAFEDPDAILAVETVGGRAGLSLWTRDQLKQSTLLRLD